MSSSRLRRLIVPLLFSFMASSHLAAQPPKVLASIKPLELIAAAITDGISKPELLLAPGSSPHDYSMRPSDIRKLTQADLVLWIGPDMETFLVKVLDRYVNKNQSLALIDQPGIQIGEGLLNPDHHSHDHNHDDHHGHHHGSYDPHIWLDPSNVLVMAKAITDKLATIDSANRQQYEHNYQAFIESMAAADKDNQELLAGLHQQGFFVFHDAWGYLARHYKLNVIDVFTINPAQAVGARHMSHLRQQFSAQNGTSCVFREPQFRPSYLNVLVNDLEIKVDVLDPLASDITPSANAYAEFLRGLAGTIHHCLTSVAQPHILTSS